MRSVSDIKDPKVGMYIGFRSGNGETESEIFYGRVVSEKRRWDSSLAVYTLDTGVEFTPANGDVLTYYGSKPKNQRAKRDAESIEARTLAYAERKTVREEIARVKAQRTLYAWSFLFLAAVLAVVGVMTKGLCW